MVKKSLYIAWCAMLALCAGMGFVPNPTGVAWWAMLALAVLTFVPPAVIIYISRKEGTPKSLQLIRNLSIGSLALTLAALVGNFMTVAAPQWVGDLLYGVLVVVSSPMICGQIWVVSLLLWAGLMWTCIFLLKKK